MKDLAILAFMLAAAGIALTTVCALATMRDGIPDGAALPSPVPAEVGSVES